jgi:hypothetical protein
MPVYFGTPPRRDGEISATLSSRGLSLVKAAPYALGILAYPIITIAVFFAYVAILPAIIAASILQVPVSSSRRGFAIGKLDNYLPFTLPKLAISFPGPVTKDNIAVLDALGFIHFKVRGKDLYTHAAPSIMTYSTVMTLNPLEITDPPYGHVNLRDFRGSLLVLKVLTAFSFVHRRKVFEEQIKETEYVEVSGTRKRKATVEAGESSTTAAQTSRRSTVMGLDEIFENVSDLLPQDLLADVMVKPLTPDAVITDLNSFQCPPSGLLFAYVSDLSLPDDVTVVSFITTYLMKLLGPTLSGQVEAIELIRSSWGHVKNSEFGFQTAHAAKVFDMAMKTQTYPLPIFSRGIYEGSILVGANFEVSVAGKLYRPLSAENLATDLQELGGHGQTVTAILELLRSGSADVSEIPDDITSMFALHSMIVKRDIGVATLKEIRRKAALLKFGSSWRINADTLTECLSLIDTTRELKEGDPIRADTLGSMNIVELALGLFGSRCPSFRIPGGSRIDLEKPLPAPAVPLQRGKKNQKRENAALWSINVRLVSLPVALSDWEMVVREKAITSVSPSVAQNAGFRSFSQAERVQLLGALRDAALDGKDFTATTEVDVSGVIVNAKESTFDF